MTTPLDYTFLYRHRKVPSEKLESLAQDLRTYVESVQSSEEDSARTLLEKQVSDVMMSLQGNRPNTTTIARQLGTWLDEYFE